MLALDDKVPDVGRLQQIAADQSGDVGSVPVVAGAKDPHLSLGTHY